MLRSHPQYTEYKVLIDSKVVCLWLTKSSVSTAELNLELKPEANNIRISPNLTYDAIAPPNRLNMKFQLIPRWFAYGSPRVVFLRQKLNDTSNFN
jgi:hypothetical protein